MAERINTTVESDLHTRINEFYERQKKLHSDAGVKYHWSDAIRQLLVGGLEKHEAKAAEH